MSSQSITYFPSRRSSDSLDVHLLGVVDFESALFLQNRLVYDISGRSDTHGGLLICEHPPIITVGRDGSTDHLPHDELELRSRELSVRWINRGGGCLVHAPGQLAVYPIIPLDRKGITLSDYRSRLEESVVRLCQDLRVAAYRQSKRPGVFCRCGQFAFIGAAVKSWVSYHGLFINVSPAMDLVRLARFDESTIPITSLAAQRQNRTPMHAVRAGLVHHLASAFGYDRYHLRTGHPLLQRMRKKIYVGA